MQRLAERNAHKRQVAKPKRIADDAEIETQTKREAEENKQIAEAWEALSRDAVPNIPANNTVPKELEVNLDRMLLMQNLAGHAVVDFILNTSLKTRRIVIESTPVANSSPLLEGRIEHSVDEKVISLDNAMNRLVSILAGAEVEAEYVSRFLGHDFNRYHFNNAEVYNRCDKDRDRADSFAEEILSVWPDLDDSAVKGHYKKDGSLVVSPESGDGYLGTTFNLSTRIAESDLKLSSQLTAHASQVAADICETFSDLVDAFAKKLYRQAEIGRDNYTFSSAQVDGIFQDIIAKHPDVSDLVQRTNEYSDQIDARSFLEMGLDQALIREL